MSSSNKNPNFSDKELDDLGTWEFNEQLGGKKANALQHSPQPSSSSSRLTVEDIENMQQQAYDESFSQGRQEGYQKGLEEGKKEGLEAGLKEGLEKGKEEGIKKGYDESIHLLHKQTAEFISLLKSLSEPFQNLDETIENELVNLSIGIAKQLVRREIKTNPEQIIAVIREAVHALPIASQKLTLHLHPNDAKLVRTSLTPEDLSPSWQIFEDSLITQGGCKVITETSHIDATVENRLAAIVANIMGGERKEDEQQ